MKRKILTIAMTVITGLTLTGCMGSSPSPDKKGYNKLNVSTDFKKDFKQYSSDLNTSSVKNLYKNPFMKNIKNPKYFVVRNIKLRGFYVRAWFHGEWRNDTNNLLLGFGFNPSRYHRLSQYNFKIGYPCNSLTECKAMLPAKGAVTKYFPYFERTPKTWEVKEMAVPEMEYDKAFFISTVTNFTFDDLAKINKTYSDYLSFVRLKKIDGGVIVKASDYNSTHHKDIINIIKKMKMSKKLYSSTYRRYGIQTKDYTKFMSEITDQILLDWEIAKPFYKKRISSIIKQEKELKKQEEREARLVKYEEKKKKELKMKKEKLKKQREAKIKALRVKEGI